MPHIRLKLIFFGFALSLHLASGWAETVVVVSTDNPTTSLSKNQIADIFLGKANHFPNGELAVPIDQVDGSLVRNDFYETFTGKLPAQLRAHWSKMIFTGRGRPPLAVGSNTEVKQKILKSSNSIGYIDDHDIDKTVKVLRIQ